MSSRGKGCVLMIVYSVLVWFGIGAAVQWLIRSL